MKKRAYLSSVVSIAIAPISLCFKAIALLLLVSSVAAADDFYVRGGLGLELFNNTAFTDIDCSSTAPAALYGCGSRDGVPFSSRGKFKKAISFDFGLGYAPGGLMRYEFLVDYRPNYKFKGKTNFLAPNRLQSVAAEVESVSGYLAAFADLPMLDLFKKTTITPYLGAGIGVARNRIGRTTMTFPKTTTNVPGGRRTNFAWMLTAGMTFPLNERINLDMAWRYADLGEVRTGRGAGSVVYRDGSQPTRDLNLAPTSARITSHSIRMSLRYSF